MKQNMTPKRIVEAYQAVEQLSRNDFPYRVSREIAALRTRLREEFEIVAEMEDTLIEKHQGKPAGNGIRFKDAGTLQAYQAEHGEKMGQTAEIDLPAVDLSAFADTIQISANGLEALEGIVLFEKGESV